MKAYREMSLPELGWYGLTHSDPRIDNMYWPDGVKGEAHMLDFQNQQKRCVAFDMQYIRFTSHSTEIWACDSPDKPDSGNAAKMYDIYFETLGAGKVRAELTLLTKRPWGIHY